MINNILKFLMVASKAVKVIVFNITEGHNNTFEAIF